MFKRLFFILFLCFDSLYSQNIKLSNSSEISIITTDAGNNLYEKFGHTAIRVQDPTLNLDLIYNYGIFDFQQKNFYLKFIKGFMEYKLMKYPFYYTLQSAENEKRSIKEQILNLNINEKQLFFNFLEENALPENANYLYDPFFNNCATKPRDIIKQILGKKLILSDDFTSNKSLKQLMNEKISENTWANLGINIALGNRLDKKATSEEYMYLPSYLFKGLSTSKIINNNKKENLIKETKYLLTFKNESYNETFSPLLFFTLLLIVGLFITFKDYKNKTRNKLFDFLLFFSTGVIGLIIVFLWFFTNHSTAPNNFNILWAFPLNFIVAFFIIKNNFPKWTNLYIKTLVLLLLIIPIIWLSEVQVFNYTLIPFFVLLFVRFLFLINYYSNKIY